MRRGPRRVQASSFRPLGDRRAEWAARLAMIASARRFLYVSTYFLEPDDYGLRFVDALIRAAERGVHVALVVDSFGQRLATTATTTEQDAVLEERLETLRSLGADVGFYRPGRILERTLGAGQHIKIQLSDAGEAIFGSSNISHRSFEAWDEFSVALRGPVVGTLLASFYRWLDRPDRAHLRSLARLAREDARRAVEPFDLTWWAWDPNDDPGALGPVVREHDNPVTTELARAISAAECSIRVTSFYFKPAPVLLDALEGAARRGVHVEVRHSHRSALEGNIYPWLSSALDYPRLLEAGVQIDEDLSGEHSKLLLVDDTWVAFGSYNFEWAADDRLAEAMITTTDVRICGQVGAFLDSLAEHRPAERVAPDAVEHWPSELRLRGLLFAPLKRWV